MAHLFLPQVAWSARQWQQQKNRTRLKQLQHVSGVDVHSRKDAILKPEGQLALNNPPGPSTIRVPDSTLW